VSTSVAVNTPRPVLSDFLNPPGVVPSPLSPRSTSKPFGTPSGYVPGSDTPHTNCSDQPTNHIPASGYVTPAQVSPHQSDAGGRRRRRCAVDHTVVVPLFPDLSVCNHNSVEESCSHVAQPPELLKPESLELVSQSVVSPKKEALTDAPGPKNKKGRAVGYGVLVVGSVAVSSWLLIKAWRRFKLSRNRP